MGRTEADEEGEPPPNQFFLVKKIRKKRWERGRIGMEKGGGLST